MAPAAHDKKRCSLCCVQEDRDRVALDHGGLDVDIWVVAENVSDRRLEDGFSAKREVVG